LPRLLALCRKEAALKSSLGNGFWGVESRAMIGFCPEG
jgi:hypothetical protein